MQRGAYVRERRPMSKEEFYAGYNITLTKAEWLHFSPGLVSRLRPVVREFAKNGFRKPRDVSRLLNKFEITTACGCPWTPRLAYFLLGRMFGDTGPSEKPRLIKHDARPTEAAMTQTEKRFRNDAPAPLEEMRPSEASYFRSDKIDERTFINRLAPLVRRQIERGTCSPKTLAAKLNSEGLPTARGTPWTVRSAAFLIEIVERGIAAVSPGGPAHDEPTTSYAAMEDIAAKLSKLGRVIRSRA